eukprot:1194173-Prorocentrum_minimum.AAC.2
MVKQLSDESEWNAAKSADAAVGYPITRNMRCRTNARNPRADCQHYVVTYPTPEGAPSPYRIDLGSICRDLCF